MIYNATCQIIEPTQQDSPGDYLQREHDETPQPEQRCWVRQTTRASEASILGQMAIGSYACRLHTTLHVGPGWRMRIKPDGSGQWDDYIVRRAGDLGFYKLVSIERVR